MLLPWLLAASVSSAGNAGVCISGAGCAAADPAACTLAGGAFLPGSIDCLSGTCAADYFREYDPTRPPRILTDPAVRQLAPGPKRRGPACGPS